MFAQFRTSTVKEFLAPDHPASSHSRTSAAQNKDRLGATSPQRSISAPINEQQQALASTAVLSPLQKLKQKQKGGLTVSGMNTKPTQSSALVDMNRPGNISVFIFFILKSASLLHSFSRTRLFFYFFVSGYHILSKTSRPPDWQINDPAEQDLNFANGSPPKATFTSNLSADKLSALVSCIPV